ncbi:MAG: hypothetical protein QGG48_11710 [Desulfatiglandales bacterium]|nr:hypothetical protein [Desulfatiglandales bacterium]
MEKGDVLEVDIEAGTIKILKAGEVMQAEKTPWIFLDIFHQGGMVD